MDKLATVLLSAYNGQKYIVQMLESIYAQDYRPLEVIIADDASKDSTYIKTREWIKLHNTCDLQFKLIRNCKNKGLSGNTSDAARYVHGQYLFLADQDDIWQKNKISKQIAYMEENKECVMCICDRSVINVQGKEVCPSVFQYKQADIRKRDYRRVMCSVAMYPANCMCLRTDNLDSIFPIPAKIKSHDTFIAIMAAHYGKIGFVKDALTKYRIHGDNLSGQYALETNTNFFKAGYIVYKSFREKKQIEKDDTVIIRQELVVRFNDNGRNCIKNVWGYEVKNVFVDTVQYLFKNRNNWKKFCG